MSSPRSQVHWHGLSKDQVREIERAFLVAAFSAPKAEEIPADPWIDIRLRKYGCPEDQLDVWRDHIWRALYVVTGIFGSGKH